MILFHLSFSASSGVSWITTNDAHVVDGIPQTKPQTLTECRSLCQQNTDCDSIDYKADGNPVKCWIFLNSLSPTLVPEQGVVHEKIVRASSK